MTDSDTGRLADLSPLARSSDDTFVPAGTRHNVRNTGDSPLRIVTTYAPSEHAPETVHRTKEEAEAAEH